MKSNYDVLGNYIRLIDTRNKDNVTNKVMGINIDKFFMPSVANVIGTDLSKYKLITKGKFACNPMHVGRDERLPVALYEEVEPALVSPAYFMFEIIDNNVLDENYLMMWFRRAEFDRICWLHTDGSVRGGITWDDICRMELPISDIGVQRKIVEAYKVVEDRIELKQKINDNLEAQAKTYFKAIFCDFEGVPSSEIEETPDGNKPISWSFARVGDFCTDNVSNLSKSDRFDSIFYLDTGSISQNYISQLQELNLATDEIPSRAKRRVFDGDIVYSTVRPNLRHYGLIQNPPENFVASTGFAILHNNGNGVSNELLYMWLTKDSVLEFLQAIAENSVSTYPSLNVSDLLEVKIIVPDDDTLKKANQVFESIYNGIAENNRQIKALENSKFSCLN